jgi:hypothetical protein
VRAVDVEGDSTAELNPDGQPKLACACVMTSKAVFVAEAARENRYGLRRDYVRALLRKIRDEHYVALFELTRDAADILHG